VFELIIRIAFSLLVVLALMWGLARVARRPLGARRTGVLTVLSRQQLSKGASVAIVKVVDRAMVLGVTDGQVTLLGEADLAAIEAFQAGPAVLREAVSLDELNGAVAPTAAAAPSTVAGSGPLAGSVLSSQTWSQTLRFLRGRMVGK
jgi:flagellar protein FliO/FliZ